MVGLKKKAPKKQYETKKSLQKYHWIYYYWPTTFWDGTYLIYKIPSDIPLEITNFSFATRCQLQIASWLKVGTPIPAPLSVWGFSSVIFDTYLVQAFFHLTHVLILNDLTFLPKILNDKFRMDKNSFLCLNLRVFAFVISTFVEKLSSFDFLSKDH